MVFDFINFQIFENILKMNEISTNDIEWIQIDEFEINLELFKSLLPEINNHSFQLKVVGNYFFVKIYSIDQIVFCEIEKFKKPVHSINLKLAD